MIVIERDNNTDNNKNQLFRYFHRQNGDELLKIGKLTKNKLKVVSMNCIMGTKVIGSINKRTSDSNDIYITDLYPRSLYNDPKWKHLHNIIE